MILPPGKVYRAPTWVQASEHAPPFAAMQSFHYPHLPSDFSTVHVALYTKVSNSAEIRSRIVRAAQLDGPDGEAERKAVNFAFIDARLVRKDLDERSEYTMADRKGLSIDM